MRLRLFRAASMASAMAQLRAELGGEALILSTRRIAGGVELTAGVEPDPVPDRAPNPAPDPVPDPVPNPVPNPVPGPQPDRALRPQRRADRLAWHGVPPGLARQLAAGPLPFAVSAALRFAALPLHAGGRPLLLVGPPGAGKTLTVARLATRLVLAGLRPHLVTADAVRAGSAEQLAALTRLLGLELIAAARPDSLARAVQRRIGGAPVLIDTHGANALDPAERDCLAALAEASGACVVLVLPAGMDAAEAADVAAAHAAAAARLLVATRLDIARRLGGVCAAAAAGLAVAEFGIGPGIAQGLVPATPALLAQRLDLAPHPSSPETRA